MRVYTYTCAHCRCVHPNMCVCAHVQAHVQPQGYAFRCTLVYLYNVSTHVDGHGCTHGCAHTRTHVHARVCTYAYTHRRTSLYRCPIHKCICGSPSSSRSGVPCVRLHAGFPAARTQSTCGGPRGSGAAAPACLAPSEPVNRHMGMIDAAVNVLSSGWCWWWWWRRQRR